MTCASKRIAAPETSGLWCATHARFTAWRVAKLSVQSSTMCASRASSSNSSADTRVASATPPPPGVIPRAPRGARLLCADRFGAVQDLALQVGEIDLVGVGERQAADAGRGEV